MIDVIIPCFNCKKTLNRALSSLSCQLDSNFGVIIADDGSTESYDDVIKRFDKLLSIKYVKSENNRGAGMARQLGLENSKADYVMFLDADDILLPYSILTFNSAIEKSNADMFTSKFYQYLNGKLNTYEDKTHCHGKLYKRISLLEKDINPGSEIRFSDDSYLNTQCYELFNNIVKLNAPTYVWIRNEDSVTFSEEFKKNELSDFIKGITKSVNKILRYKPLDDISFIDGIIDVFRRLYKNNKSVITKAEELRIEKELEIFNRTVHRNVELHKKEEI